MKIYHKNRVPEFRHKLVLLLKPEEQMLIGEAFGFPPHKKYLPDSAFPVIAEKLAKLYLTSNKPIQKRQIEQLLVKMKFALYMYCPIICNN